jgi:hypothetical protein
MSRMYGGKVVRNELYKGMETHASSTMWLMEEGRSVPYSH